MSVSIYHYMLRTSLEERSSPLKIYLCFLHTVSAMKMEAVVYSGVLVNFDQATRHYISGVRNLRALGYFSLW